MKSWLRKQPWFWRSAPLRDCLFSLSMALALLYSMHALNFGQSANWRLYDQILRWSGFQARSDIVVIAIDDRALEELQDWPLPRKHYTQLLTRLQQEGIRPKAIGVDLIFNHSTQDDLALGQAMQHLPMVLPLSMKEQRQSNEMASRDSKSTRTDFWDSPPDAIKDSASAFGHIQIQFDEDGVIRTIDNSVMGVAHLALAMAQLGSPSTDQTIQRFQTYSKWRKNFHMVDTNVGFTTLSLADALNPVLSLDMLQDKWVLIGVTAKKIGDNYPTSYTSTKGTSTPGVYIVASTLNDLLNHSAIRVIPTSITVTVGTLVLLYLSVVLIRTPPIRVLTTGLALSGLLLCLAYLLLTQLNFWINFIPLCLTIQFMTGIWSWRRLVSTVGQIRSEIRTRFTLPPQDSSHNISNHPVDWWLKNFKDTPQRVVEQLHSAIDTEQKTFKLLQASLQQVPTPIAIFDQQDQHWVSNQAMHAVARQCGLMQTAPRYNFAQLQDKLLTFTNDPLRQNIDRAIITMDRFSQLSTFYQATVSTICVSETQQLRMVTLLDITWSQRHHNQREETLQFLSHDMRTPLACMQASMDHLRQIKLANPADIDRTLYEIGQQAERLKKMMDGFIIHSQAHQAQLQLTECLLQDLLDDAVAQSFELVRQYGIQITIQECDIPLRVQVDVQMILRTLINVIHNAIRHCETGQSIIVRSQISQGEQGRPVAQVHIENPVGNPHAKLAIEHQGFGLGLKFVQTVLNLHQGRLTISIPPALATPRVAVVCIELPLLQ